MARDGGIDPPLTCPAVRGCLLPAAAGQALPTGVSSMPRKQNKSARSRPGTSSQPRLCCPECGGRRLLESPKFPGDLRCSRCSATLNQNIKPSGTIGAHSEPIWQEVIDRSPHYLRDLDDPRYKRWWSIIRNRARSLLGCRNLLHDVVRVVTDYLIDECGGDSDVGELRLSEVVKRLPEVNVLHRESVDRQRQKVKDQHPRLAIERRHIQILEVLAKRPNSLMTRDQIAGKAVMDGKTASNRLKDLVSWSLVEKPRGPKQGHRITASGQEMINNWPGK